MKEIAVKKIAVVFPGQGSQSVGMVADLYDKFSVVRDTYAEASEALGFDLWALSNEGPAEALNQTVNTQPAMLAAGVACWRALQETQAFTPDYFAGHSLGEYTALVASEQLTFSEAIRLARRRAEAMQAAVPAGVGAMAAILGLDAETIETACAQTSTAEEKVWAANDNAPGQIVIAGHKGAVEQACQALKAQGAKRALMLPVSVPSHTPLMASAVEAMKTPLASAQWQQRSSIPVIHNSDVAPHSGASEVITALCEQLVKPVRWVETVQYFASYGVDSVIEVGPGKVLAGLTKRIDRSLTAKCVCDGNSLEEVATFVKDHFSS